MYAVAVLALSLALAAPAYAKGRTYEKMVARPAAVGHTLRPFFVRAVLDGKIKIKIGTRTIESGRETEQLFQRVFVQLKKDGRVGRTQPGRADGIFVAKNLAQFSNLLRDPNLHRISVTALDESRVATYDRRYYHKALLLLERARHIPEAKVRARLRKAANEAAHDYFLKPPAASDRRAEAETILGGGGRVAGVR